MKLDRELNPDGTGKYFLILNRQRLALPAGARREVEDAMKVLAEHGVLDTGNSDITEFFVIRLRDRFAQKALEAYAWEAEQAASEHGHTSEHETELREYAAAVFDLAQKSDNHPAKHQPD